MINKIDSRLKQEGYRFLKVKPEEAGVYYKYADGSVRVLVGFYGHEEFQLYPVHLEQIFSNLQELFCYSQGRLEGIPATMQESDVEILAFVVTLYPERFRELCLGNLPVWLCDMSAKRLLIYENQPGNFYGVETVLQEIVLGNERIYEPDGNDTVMQSGKQAGVRDFPVVTVVLAAINILVFLFLELQGDTEDGMFMLEHGAMYPDYAMNDGEWYRLFTCMFLHFGVEHLMNNMVMLVVAGMQLERALGTVKYLLLYLLSGMGGSVLSLIIMNQSRDYAISAGASGAVFGIIGGLLWVAIRNHGRFERLTARGVLVMIALSLYYGFTSTGVDNWGHIGGVVAGFLLSVLLYRRRS